MFSRVSYILHTSAEHPLNKPFLQTERNLYDTDILESIQKDIAVWFENGFAQIYWSEDDIKEMHKESEKLLDIDQAKKTIGSCREIYNLYWKVQREIIDSAKKPLTKREIAILYDRYISLFRRLLWYFIAMGDKLTYAVEKDLEKILEEKLGRKAKEGYISITTPTDADLLHNELMDWRKVITNPAHEMILEHANKYSILLPNTFSHEDALSWAKSRLGKKSLAEIEHEILSADNRRKKVKERQREIFSKLRSERAEELSSFIREITLIRLLLKSCWNGEAYHMLPFYERIAAIAGCSLKDLYMLYTREEIHNLLHKNINITKEELEQRKKYCLLHLNNKKIRIYSGEEALAMKKKIIDPSLPKKEIKSFRGNIANMGKVVGPVKVIKTDTPSVMEKIARELTPEHILVAGMTNPAMIVLIKKVKGIITDEGGIACHAAIISREMGVPCIIGTKLATSILKDGEIVELDADRGIITRL